MSESEELGRLGDLHQRGVLSDEEFARAKARVLSGVAGASYQAPAMGALHAWRRARADRWLGGVCGGIGQVTGMPSWVWRLFFVLLVLFGGTGILVYALMWIFVPEEPAVVAAPQQAY
jgi:phage shock protein PspC (stress-responsive transcriptional regulator)